MIRTLPLTLMLAVRLVAQTSAPDYTQSSLVHAATFAPGPLAPNTIASIFGRNLSQTTRALLPGDIRGGLMPNALPLGGTIVLVGGLLAPLFYVSPTQINFLVPADLLPGDTRVVVVSSGLSGRETRVTLAPAAPGIFQISEGKPAATDANGRLITADAPIAAGEWVILYATGLGDCLPPPLTGEIAKRAAVLTRPLTVWLGNTPVQPSYAGLAPGYAGLYQVNFQVPGDVTGAVNLRVEVDGALSPAGIVLPVR